MNNVPSSQAECLPAFDSAKSNEIVDDLVDSLVNSALLQVDGEGSGEPDSNDTTKTEDRTTDETDENVDGAPESHQAVTNDLSDNVMEDVKQSDESCSRLPTSEESEKTFASKS